MSCKDRARDNRFKEIMVRLPIDRYPELEAVSKSQGLKAGVYIRTEICKILNEIKQQHPDQPIVG